MAYRIAVLLRLAVHGNTRSLPCPALLRRTHTHGRVLSGLSCFRQRQGRIPCFLVRRNSSHHILRSSNFTVRLDLSCSRAAHLAAVQRGQRSYLAAAIALPIVGELARVMADRSEEHTSELQSLRHLVCRL